MCVTARARALVGKSEGRGRALVSRGRARAVARAGAARRGGRSHLMVLLGVRPCHPIPLDPNPNLLAMTFLSAWGLGSAINPVSGTLLAIQGNYHIKGSHIARINSLPIAFLFCINCAAYYLFSLFI